MSKFPREEMQRRLAALAQSKPPRDLSPGAMCYRMAGPPEVAEYRCPACGAKTWYALGPKPKGIGTRLNAFLAGQTQDAEQAEVVPDVAGPKRVLPRDSGGRKLPGFVQYTIPYCRRQLEGCHASQGRHHAR